MFLMRRGLVFLAFLLCPALSFSQHPKPNFSRATAYHFSYFQVPGAALTSPSSINDSLTITGTYSTQAGFTGGFVRTASGQITTFDVGQVYTGQLRINAAGVIAGIYQDVSGMSRGFVRSANGSITKFNPGGPAGSTQVTDINDGGTVVGIYLPTNTDPPSYAYVRTPDGTITTFTVPGGSLAFPWSINDLGEVTGNYYYDNDTQVGGFVRSPGGMFTTFGYSDGVVPLAINLAGTTTGWYGPPVGNFAGFVRQPDGTVTPFSLPQTGAIDTLFLGINDAGFITGSYTVLNSGSPVQGPGEYMYGFVRSPQGVLSSFSVPGASSTTAVAINNLNVVTGSSDSTIDPGGFIRIPMLFFEQALSYTP
jgi:hypothetical protein